MVGCGGRGEGIQRNIKYVAFVGGSALQNLQQVLENLTKKKQKLASSETSVTITHSCVTVEVDPTQFSVNTTRVFTRTP